MPRKIAETTLNASTIDILNVIRQNLSAQYQDSVPAVSSATDIPKVGEILYGHPAMANEFLNALINRIAAMVVESAVFNNPYRMLKKGVLSYGETIEDVFVSIVKALRYDVEKAPAREFKRTIPNVHSVFHTINWKVLYPVTIEKDELNRAFLSEQGVLDMIARIVDQIYTAAEYDEFLLVKWLLVKSVNRGGFKPVGIDVSNAATADNNAAIAFRGYSNLMQFMSSDYNESHVLTATPRERQVIIMPSLYNAQFDVNVLAASFHMDRAEFMSRLLLIDDFTTFDNDRFSEIMAESDGLAAVTDAELAVMADVKAILVDENWFQIYDNLNEFTEKYVASGLYWNYFYHQWKTISYSPFANGIVFVKATAVPDAPESLTATVTGLEKDGDATIILLSVSDGGTTAFKDYRFIETSTMAADLIAIQPYGAVIVPEASKTEDITLVCEMGGVTYTASSAIKASTVTVGATVTLAAPND